MASDTESAKERPNDNKKDNGPFLIDPLPLPRELLMVITIISAQAMVQACLLQGLVPVQLIARSFGQDSLDAAWGPAGYALTSGKLLL